MALSENWENFIRLHGWKAGAREAFEKLMFEILQIENSDKEVHTIREGRDPGADILVHQEDGVDAYQCKFYIDSMKLSRWNQIKESYDRTVDYNSRTGSEESRIHRWFLCMPYELQKEDLDKWRRFCDERKAYGIETYLIDGNEIIQRMKACDSKYGTDLIARYFAVTQTEKRALHTIPRILTPIPAADWQLDVVGRESLVEQVITRLESENSVIALSGVGGIGKTAVMRQVCNAVAEKGHYVAWIDCRGSFKEDILGLGEALGVVYENADNTYSKILSVLKSQLPGELYLFFDGLESPLSEDEVKDLASLNAHIMITSRQHQDIAFTIDLENLSTEEALNMFFHYYNENRNRMYEGEAKIIINSVNRNTLLVELLAKAARKTGGTLKSFSERLASEGFINTSIQKIKAPHDGYQNLTIEQSVMKLYALSHMTEEQQRIMRLFSIFTPAKEIFWKLPEWAELDMDAVDELVDLGWLERTGPESNYIIHPLISDSVKIQLQKQGTEVKLEEYGSLLSKVADTDKYMPEDLEHVKVRERLVLAEDLARYLLNRTDRIMEQTVLPEDSAVLKSAANLYYGVAGVFYKQGEYEKALKYYRKTLAIQETVLGSEHASTAMTYNNMGIVYSDQGDYDSALEYFRKALAIQEKVPDSEHLSTATTYNNMAGVFENQGDYARALEYYGKALAIQEKVLGREYPSTATAYRNIAKVYSHQGDYERALEYYGKALAIQETVLGSEHPSTATAYRNIARVYSYMADYERALEYYGKALAIQEKVLGSEHPSTAMTYNNMALVYAAQGGYARALEYYGKALAIQEKVLGSEHPSTAMTYNNMALVYAAQGGYARALEYYGKAFAIQEKVLGSEHPDTATTYNNMAGLYEDQGDYDRALEYYGKALAIAEKVLGSEHPDTATTYDNMAGLFRAQGDYARALECYEKALTIRERVLGTEHPDTGTTYNNMALLYINIGDYEKAQAYLNKAIVIRENVLGSDHPETARTYNNMARVLLEEGDYTKARTFFEKALDICERTLGSAHPLTAEINYNIAKLLCAQGLYVEAVGCFRRSLGVAERVLGTKHHFTLEIYHNLASTYTSLKDYANAEKYYLLAISAYEIDPGLPRQDYILLLKNIAGVYYQQLAYDKSLSYFVKALKASDENSELMDDQGYYLCKMIAEIYTKQGKFNEAAEYQERAQNYNREYNYSRDQEPTACQIELLTIIAKAKGDKYSKSFLLNLLGEESPTYEDAVLRLSLGGWVVEENGSLYLDPSLSSDVVIPDNYRLESDADFYRKLLLNYMALPYEQIKLYSKSVLPVILNNLQDEDSDEKFAADILCNMDMNNEQFISKYPDCVAACFCIDSRHHTRKYGFYDIAQNRFISFYECTIKSDENEINLLKAYSRALFKLDFSVIDKEGRISEIPDRFCYNNKFLSELTLPEKLSRIGDESFSGCSGLNIVLELPRELKYIGREAFLGCINLRGDVCLPVGLIEIGDKAFAGCSNLSRNIYLSNSIRRIGEYAFCYDYKQKDSSENHIGPDEALEGKATTVGKIFFPEKTTVISNRAFIDCTGLYGELQIREGITEIGDWAFKGCTNISGKLSFPKSLAKIGNNAFDGCSGLTEEILFRENLTDIGEYAFRGCSHLSGKIELPDSLKEVKAATFNGCSDLSGELKLPANLRSIGNSAFMNCTGLNSGITFPDTLALVGDFAFKNCRGLSGTLNLCESMVFIGDNAFEGCSGLTGEVRLPESMLSVGKEAFAGCSGLKTNALNLKSYESRKYVRSFLNNSEPLNECKVIFLGDGGAGKSLIIQRLMNDGATVPDFRGDSTPGIQIFNHEEYIGVDRFQIHYWDFGGQEILHSMHRMFMTKRTLYVIVVNARGNMQDESANYWLHDVNIYAPESPVLLVINQIDQNPAASINETRLREQYPQLLATVKISARDFDKNKFKNDFIAILHKYIKKVPGVYALFPVKWRNLFDHVRRENTNFIYKSRFNELCRENKIDDFEDIQQILTRKIQELGVGFLYGKNVYADDGMLLKPVWLLNAIYIILFNGSKFTDNKEKNGGNGVLSHQLIEKMLLNPDYDDDEVRKVVKDEKYEKSDVEYILSVIRQYRLSYKVGDDADFFPMLCDRNENSSSWNGDDENALHMILRYKYKPLDIFHRLIIEMHKDLDMEKVWYSGALMKNTDDKVIAYINVQGNDLHIRVKSDSDNKSANRYLLIIHDQISAINELLGVTADELVVYQKDGKESEFYFDDLKGSEEAGIEYIYSRVHESKICVKDILYYSDSNLREYHQKLLAALIEALQKLQNNYVYHWRIEDDRNTYVRDLLEMRSYICKDQSRGGLSESKSRDGERDIVILDTNRKWSTIYEALNLRSFDNEAQKNLDGHISKLLDNYNPIGFPILYLVVYAEWAPDMFDENKQKYFEHVKSYSNNHFTVKNSNSMEHGEGQYLYHAKVLYNCGGIPFTIHHIVVRVGDVDNDNLMQSVYDLAKENGQITRKEVEESCGINETKARAIINRLCKDEQLLKQGKGQHITYIFSGHKA